MIILTCAVHKNKPRERNLVRQSSISQPLLVKSKAFLNESFCLFKWTLVSCFEENFQNLFTTNYNTYLNEKPWNCMDWIHKSRHVFVHTKLHLSCFVRPHKFPPVLLKPLIWHCSLSMLQLIQQLLDQICRQDQIWDSHGLKASTESITIQW